MRSWNTLLTDTLAIKVLYVLATLVLIDPMFIMTVGSLTIMKRIEVCKMLQEMTLN